MARRRYWIGSLGPFFYDDEAPVNDPQGIVVENQAGLVAEGSVKALDSPSGDYDLVRMMDLAVTGKPLQILTTPVTVANSYTEQSIFRVSIPATQLIQPCMISSTLYGYYQSLADSFTLRSYYGSLLISSIESEATAQNQDTFFYLRTNITIIDRSSLGQFIASSLAMFQDRVEGDFMTDVQMLNLSTTQELEFTLQWSAASAENTFTLIQGIVRF